MWYFPVCMFFFNLFFFYSYDWVIWSHIYIYIYRSISINSQTPNCSKGPERWKCSDRLCNYPSAAGTRNRMHGEFANYSNMGTTDGASQMSLELLIPTLHQHVWCAIFFHNRICSTHIAYCFLAPRFLKKGTLTPSILEHFGPLLVRWLCSGTFQDWSSNVGHWGWWP